VGGTDHDPRAQDIWACGVTLFVLLCRCYPFGRKDSRRGCRQVDSLSSQRFLLFPPSFHPLPPTPYSAYFLPPLFFFLSSFLCDSLRHSLARSVSRGQTCSHTLSNPRNLYFCSRILSLFLSPRRPLSLAHDRFQQFFSMLDSDKDDAYPPTHKAYWNAADAYLMGNVTPGGTRKHTYTQVHRHTHTHSHTHAHTYKHIHAHTYTHTLHTHTLTQSRKHFRVSACMYLLSAPPFYCSLTPAPLSPCSFCPLSGSFGFLSDECAHVCVFLVDMRAIIQSQESGSSGGGLACIDLLNRLWDCRTKRRITAKQVFLFVYTKIIRLVRTHTVVCVCICVYVCLYACSIWIQIYMWIYMCMNVYKLKYV